MKQKLLVIKSLISLEVEFIFFTILVSEVNFFGGGTKFVFIAV